MCEIFGISSSEETYLNDYLKIFYSHSDFHSHGWGLACMEGQEVNIEKEPLQALKSRYLKERMATEIKARIAFAHIRYATVGNIEYNNCHPYTIKDNSGRRWTMVHNGTIFDFPELAPYARVQKGDTDSERILLYIVDKMHEAIKEKKRVLMRTERFEILDKIVSELSKGNKLNLLLYDGELVYVHTNYKDSLYQLKKDHQALFSTTPLTEENWQPVPFTTLQAYEHGERVFQGTNHRNEYIENEENTKFLYQIMQTCKIFAGMEVSMKTREEALVYGMTFPDTYQEKPFHDDNWQLVRVKGSKKAFLWIYEHKGFIQLNVKVDPMWRDFWRNAYESVIPGWHQNKEHWNTIILDGSIPEEEIKRMISESYELVTDSPSKRIYEAVRKIPAGHVATYGQVAKLAGNPKMARAVGNALHKNPDPENIPCHRVVNAKGECSGAFAFGGPDAQAEKLRAEGVEVVDGKVDLKKYSIVIRKVEI